jgi:hypothetical protein
LDVVSWIVQTFKENPYFTNKELVKEIVYGTENTPPKFTSTKINWKPGKVITLQQNIIKKNKHKETIKESITLECLFCCRSHLMNLGSEHH